MRPYRCDHKQGEYRRQNVYAWLFLFAQAVLVIALLFFLVLTPVRVTGSSMSPTLTPDEILLIDRLSLYLRTPKRGDMVIFSHPETGEELIKRVIGLPGEIVQISGGQVYIDGRLLDESAYLPAPAPDFPATVVEPYTVFVLGDARGSSLDSRDPSLGLVPLERLDGRVRIRVAPLSKANLFV